MDQLERPDETTWDERRLWFEEREATYGQSGATILSEQACAMMIDLQATFCAGAWSAVVILAATIVESQLRSTDDVAEAMQDEDLRWLRQLRNVLLHEDPRAPAITVEDQWTGRDRWERHARRAVDAALSVLYRKPSKRASAVAKPRENSKP